MAGQFLFRDGMPIPLEKTEAYFTTKISNRKAAPSLLQQLPGVASWRHVFEDFYKVETSPDRLDMLMDQLREGRQVVHHAYSPAGDPATRYYITDKLIITFSAGSTVTEQERILEKYGLKWIKTYDEHFTHLVQVTNKSGKNPIKVSNDLIEESLVTEAEPNIVNRFLPFYSPLDSLFKKQWHLDSGRGIELEPDAHIDMVRAWDISRGNRAVVVGVIDDGFDLTHPDLSGEEKVKFGRDFVDMDFMPLAEKDRGDFHGTPCAGLAIGEENGDGIMGVAPNCSFMPIRINFAADDNQLFEIFEYAGHRANVLSCSWGPLPVFAPIASLLKRQIKRLAESGGPDGKGCVICFAAGNNNAPLNAPGNQNFKWRHPVLGFKETKGKILNGYAAHPDIITVSASTSQNLKAVYSNWGREVNICAPSNNVHPLEPSTELPGRGIWTADNQKHGVGYDHWQQYTGYFGGTSAATPLVAGVAALVKSVFPTLTAHQIKHILEETADKIKDHNPDSILGHYKGRYNEQGHSEWFGYGKVNAWKALQKAIELGGEGQEVKPLISKFSGLKIVAAHVNPPGLDRGLEKISIINTTKDTLNLVNGRIIDEKGRTDTVEAFFIPSGQIYNIYLRKARLNNRGGTIRLLDDQGAVIHVFSYHKNEIGQSGWVVKV